MAKQKIKVNKRRVFLLYVAIILLIWFVISIVRLFEKPVNTVLVKKGESKVRATRKIKEQNEEDVVTIKRKIDEFNPEDYKVQIRADKYDEQGNKLRGTDLVFEMDIEEELSSVLEQGRSR